MTFTEAVIEMTRRKGNKLRSLQAKAWVKATVVAAAEAAPGPGDTAVSTGRSRMSIRSNIKTPRGYDPGLRSVYRKPGARQALFGIKGRKGTQGVVVDIGVHYARTVEKYHAPIKAGARAGKAVLLSDHDKHVRMANKGHGTLTVRLGK